MKLTIKLLLLSALIPVQAGPAGAAPLSAPDVNCAAEDMQLAFYYLAPDPGQKVKERPTACHGGQTVLKMPDWLEKDLPAMQERKVWTDPEEGKLSEAQLWQAPFSILYELADMTKKTVPQGAASAAPAALQAHYDDIRQRFILSADRLARAGLEGSFEGRGTAMLTAMNAIEERLDSLTDALDAGDNDAFYRGAGDALNLSRDLFAQLFEAPRGEPGAKFEPKYSPEPRLLPGYRGVSLSVPGSQVMFLSPGERIDMLATFDAVTGGAKKDKVTATILQNVVVLKVKKPETPGGTGVVQLLCNPNEAQYVALSLVQCGSINLVRRAPGDVKMSPMEIASFRKLFK